MRYVTVGEYLLLEGLLSLKRLGCPHSHLDFVTAVSFIEGTEVFVACDYCDCQRFEGLSLGPYDLLVVGLGEMCGLGLCGKQ